MSLLKDYTAVYALAAPGANTDIIAADIAPSAGVSRFELTVALATGSVFNMAVTNGATPYTLSFNSGAALVADCVYTFTFGVRDDLTYNFQVATDGVIKMLFIEELL